VIRRPFTNRAARQWHSAPDLVHAGERGRAGIGDAGGMSVAGYPRSTGTPRGEARRRELLERVTADLAANGLVGFSLRRAAKAAGTTHKVLLYHFESADDLLRQAVFLLRERRIARSVDGWTDRHGSLVEWIDVAWRALLGEESTVLDQVIGLVLYDTDRYRELAAEASAQYLPTLVARCPDDWSEQRKLEVAHLILGALRGFLIERATTGEVVGVEAGLAALRRAVGREVQAL
jgi:AcrR family transcriptional regulator